MTWTKAKEHRFLKMERERFVHYEEKANRFLIATLSPALAKYFGEVADGTIPLDYTVTISSKEPITTIKISSEALSDLLKAYKATQDEGGQP